VRWKARIFFVIGGTFDIVLLFRVLFLPVDTHANCAAEQVSKGNLGQGSAGLHVKGFLEGLEGQTNPDVSYLGWLQRSNSPSHY
jgi:hypothetical protein